MNEAMRGAALLCSAGCCRALQGGALPCPAWQSNAGHGGALLGKAMRG